ncbi:MAG: protein-disulfide reductase DsbD, partial [Oleiphilaceae bacterium]|nr:protein-disulfide reductase DsbD [Oleiphilaceae bacterium]
MPRNLTSVLSLFCLLGALLTATAWAQSSLLGSANDFASDAQAEPEFLKVDEAFLFVSEIVPGGLKLSWDIADEYFLYLERFKFRVESDGLNIGEPEYSQQGKKKDDPYFGEVHVIHDSLDVFLPISLAAGVTDGEVRVTYQGCAEAGLCYPPVHQTTLYLPSDEAPATLAPAKISQGGTTINTNTGGAGTAGSPSLENAGGVFEFIQSSSLTVIIGIFFLLGIGLTFTPCVFPMIPIITSIIAGQKAPTALKSFVLAMAYVLGMALTYSAAGVATGMLGAGANVQAALQEPWLLSIFAAIFVALALAMFGVYELQLPAFVRDRLNTTSQSISGGKLGSVFAIGALSALVVSPCVSAPLAGALLYISSTGDAVIGGASLFALGMGMGVPLILIAVGGGKLLPKAGAWMNHVKALFGVMLMAVAIWLISRIVPGPVSLLLWAVLLGLTAAHMGAFEAAERGWPRLAKGSGLILAFVSALLLVGAATGAHDPLRPLAMLQANSGSNTQLKTTKAFNFEVIYDEKGLMAQQQQSTLAQQPMMVDFYADWC